MNVIAFRDAAKQNREAELQQMDAEQLWYILEHNYHKKMPAPSMFDENAHYFLKEHFIREILQIEYGCE